MSAHETSDDSGAVGHEVRDVRFRPLVLASIGLAFAVLAAMAGMKGLFDFLSAREARRSAAVSPSNAAARRHEPPEPRLQTAPIQDLKQLRAHVVPRVARPLLANLLQGACGLIGLEAALSFAGLGLPSAVPSWGGGLAAVGATGSWQPLALAAASIGSSCAALYWLGAHLAAARPRPNGTQPAPLVELGAARSGG